MINRFSFLPYLAHISLFIILSSHVQGGEREEANQIYSPMFSSPDSIMLDKRIRVDHLILSRLFFFSSSHRLQEMKIEFFSPPFKFGKRTLSGCTRERDGLSSPFSQLPFFLVSPSKGKRENSNFSLENIQSCLFVCLRL